MYLRETALGGSEVILTCSNSQIKGFYRMEAMHLLLITNSLANQVMLSINISPIDLRLYLVIFTDLRITGLLGPITYELREVSPKGWRQH